MISVRTASTRRRGTRPRVRGALAILFCSTWAGLSPSGASALDVRPLWNFADPARSEANFRARLESATGDDVLSLQTQIARSLGLRSRFNEAHALLDQLEPRLASAGPEPRVRYLLERGRTLRSSHRSEPARPLFMQAVDLALAAKLDELSVDAMHMVALVETEADAQLRWNQRALEFAQESNDANAHDWDASLATNIGMTLHEQGRYKAALASFNRASRRVNASGRRAGYAKRAGWSRGRCVP